MPLDERALEVLTALREWQALAASQPHYRNAEGWLISTGMGSPQHPGNFDRDLRTLCQRAGVPYLPPHALRHSYASIGLSNGTQPDVMAKLLGHADATVTLRIYRHVYKHEVVAPRLW